MIEKILAERGGQYGAFPDVAAISQAIKRVMHSTPNWALLTDAQKEALEMIALKIARTLNGDPTHADNPIDIGGYAALMVRSMQEGR